MFIFYVFISSSICAQRFRFNGGILGKVEITLGNQNQWFKLGAYGYAILNYGDTSIESGGSIYSHYLLKRHTKKNNGLGYGYECFALAGIGKNTNLLGSSISNQTHEIFFDSSGKGGFKGLGFGFEKEVLSSDLREYNPRRGSFLIRFSNANHNISIAFLNDFRFGNLFYGQASDYAETGTLRVRYNQYQKDASLYSIGGAMALFTPKPDYSKTPKNPINSHDGRKNVWFTLPPYKDLFYANIYAFGSYQKDGYSITGHLGMNSQKLGAFVQNMLHDGFGLNPRFPWNVETKDKVYYQFSGTLYTAYEDYD